MLPMAKVGSEGRMSALGFCLWIVTFKQSPPFRIHLAVKTASQVIICEEVDSIRIFLCSGLYGEGDLHVSNSPINFTLPTQKMSVKHRMSLIREMQHFTMEERINRLPRKKETRDYSGSKWKGQKMIQWSRQTHSY